MTKTEDNPDAYAVVESDHVYQGRLVSVRRDKVRMPAGNIATREVVETTDAVAIVALDERGRVCLIRQYRHPQGEFLWEVPAGRIDSQNESPLDTAKRELQEEVRLVSDVWKFLITYISSAGFATEKTHIFLAERACAVADGTGFEARNEEQEIVIDMRPLDKAIADVRTGILGDAKTVIGLLLTARHLHL